MAKARPQFYAFNRGEVSNLGIARVDLERMRLSAEQQLNWIPRVLGSMMLRPGLGYIGGLKSNAYSKYLPFVFSTSDTALIELSSSGVMRVWIDDALVTRVSVSTAITNGLFTSNINDWTDSDEGSASSAYVTGGYMGLTGTGYDTAKREQEVTVSAGDQNKEHALRIVIARGPVTLRVGSTSGDDDYISETSLATGYHSLAFTPTGNFHVEFSNVLASEKLVDSIAVESAGTMEVTTPWFTETALKTVRYSQSGDVIFIASSGLQQRRIERRSARSWSIVNYAADDGPFRIENTGPTRISPSALSGNVTLTASQSLFRAGHVGALFRISSIGQRVEATISAEDQWTDPVRVTGVGASRNFVAANTGTGSATITLQRSVSEPGSWTDVLTLGATAGYNYNDGLDNQIIYYRVGCKTGNYVSGTRDVSITYSGGSIDGVARILTVASSTSATAEVLVPFGGTAPSEVWWEGSWSDYRGWPTSVALFEGRLWWAGRGSIWGSASDAYSSYDDTVEGDSGPLSRSIGEGPVDTINWLLPLQRLILGAQGSEISAKSSSIDEPLSPTNFAMKASSTQGSSGVPAVKIDQSGVMVQRGGTKVYRIGVDPNAYGYDYATTDMTLLKPEMCSAGVSALAVQRQPDTRIHAVLEDGTVAVSVYDSAEDVTAWLPITTPGADGEVEDVVVLPSDGSEDRVYYAVKRTVNSATVRYLEKWALESECVGGTLNKQADSFVTFTNSPAAASVPAGTCSHLVGESVVVWADGKCLEDADGNIATFTVAADGGIAALTDGGASYSATTGVVGLSYEAKYKSRKLAEGSEMARAGVSTMNERKSIDHVGLVLANTHHKGLKYGLSFDRLYDLPGVEDYQTVTAGTIHSEYDKETIPVEGGWNVDSRMCLYAKAPRPATVLALSIAMQASEKS